MSRLTIFLDWLDEAAAGLIRLAYLAAGITAVAVYFGAGHLPLALEYALNAALPWVLASAIEMHTYLTARRVRSAWQDRHLTSYSGEERVRAGEVLRVNLVVLAVLLAFSAWNQLGYLAATWRPPATAFALPGWTTYVVRALIVPGAFMAAAFMAPQAPSMTAQLEAEAQATLADVFKIARKQRRRLLIDAEQSGRDMSGALVELVPNPEARRIIAHAYAAIRGGPLQMHQTDEVEGTHAMPTLDSGIVPMSSAGEVQLDAPIGVSQTGPTNTPRRPDDPPTGPGTPRGSNRRQQRRVQTLRGRNVPEVLRLRRDGEYDAERRIRSVLKDDQTASIKQIAERAEVSTATASKWRRIILAEQQSSYSQRLVR